VKPARSFLAAAFDYVHRDDMDPCCFERRIASCYSVSNVLFSVFRYSRLNSRSGIFRNAKSLNFCSASASSTPVFLIQCTGTGVLSAGTWRYRERSQAIVQNVGLPYRTHATLFNSTRCPHATFRQVDRAVRYHRGIQQVLGQTICR
jgi:hypothetical protein